VKAGFEERIMFGSDQMVGPQSFCKAVGSIERADFLTDEQKDAIFYGNAARFHCYIPCYQIALNNRIVQVGTSV
jgi:predicted TIM-barrel fold metal-dependent hydrolase